MKTTFLTTYFEADGSGVQAQARCRPWWLYANLLSLDAPVVAVVWLGVFSRAFESSVNASVYAVLFLAVWSIYIADRLVDGLRQKNWRLAAARHRFVHRHQKRFIGLMLVILPLTAVIALTTLPIDLIVAGCILGAAVVLYFTAFVRLFPKMKPLRAKEFACGFVFAVGTSFGVDAVRHGVMTDLARVISAILLFAALCIYNCLIIAARERHSDQANDPASASVWWKYLDRDLAVFGTILIMASGIGWSLSSLFFIYPACFVSAVALASVHFFHHRISDSMSRVLVDVALLSPLLLLI